MSSILKSAPIEKDVVLAVVVDGEVCLVDDVIPVVVIVAIVLVQEGRKGIWRWGER